MKNMKEYTFGMVQKKPQCFYFHTFLHLTPKCIKKMRINVYF